MASIAQIRGMLLEEALLHLLRGTGYRTVDHARGDPTLDEGSAGLLVKGRGSSHQIDAIADFRVHQPFSYPQRLLVEAKCLSPGQRVGLPVVRGVVGTLKDVSEYWVTRTGTGIPKGRFHYQYAIFSATGYTRDAERYAFAQDVYLIPLADSTYFRPIIDAIRNVQVPTTRRNRGANLRVDMKQLRRAVRGRLRDGAFRPDTLLENLGPMGDLLADFTNECQHVRFGLLGVIGGRFPVFLVPSSEARTEPLEDTYTVRIFWDDSAWYLRDARTHRLLFSFDLPRELFLLYANQGMLSATQALDLKKQEMEQFQAVIVRKEKVRIITFRLDQDWLEGIRARVGRRS